MGVRERAPPNGQPDVRAWRGSIKPGETARGYVQVLSQAAAGDGSGEGGRQGSGRLELAELDRVGATIR